MNHPHAVRVTRGGTHRIAGPNRQPVTLSFRDIYSSTSAPALVALLGGHVPFAFNHVVAALPHIQSGKLRAMAVTA